MDVLGHQQIMENTVMSCDKLQFNLIPDGIETDVITDLFSKAPPFATRDTGKA